MFSMITISFNYILLQLSLSDAKSITIIVDIKTPSLTLKTLHYKPMNYLADHLHVRLTKVLLDCLVTATISPMDCPSSSAVDLLITVL